MPFADSSMVFRTSASSRCISARSSVRRDASAHEAERMGKYYDETLRSLAADSQTVAALFPNRIEGVPQMEAAAWVELSRVLLNLDEFITRE